MIGKDMGQKEKGIRCSCWLTRFRVEPLAKQRFGNFWSKSLNLNLRAVNL